MAFSRQNTGSTSTFIRDGALTSTTNIPPFQIFQTSTASSTYSLGGTWKISIDHSADTLKFLNNNSSVLTIGTTGIQGVVNTALKLGNNAEQPTLSLYENGDMVKIQGELYIKSD